MTSLADTFAHVAAAAMALDPDGLRATILATHDRLPGGSRSSETGIRAPRMERCTDPRCEHGDWHHDHPIPNDPTGDAALRPSESDRDLHLLADLEAAFVEAVAELTQRSYRGAPPATWDEAVKDAHLLVEMDAIPPLVTAWGHGRVRGWVQTAGDAVSSIEHLTHRQMPRKPDDHERTWTSNLADEQCCRVCLKLGLRVQWQDGGAGGLCQACYRLRRRCAAVTGVPYDEVPDPPETLVEELRRINTPGGPHDLAARSRWYQRIDDEARSRRHCA